MLKSLIWKLSAAMPASLSAWELPAMCKCVTHLGLSFSSKTSDHSKFLCECTHELQPMPVYEPNGDIWRQRSIVHAKMELRKGARHRKSKTRAARRNALPTIRWGSSNSNVIEQSILRCVNGCSGVVSHDLRSLL